MRKRTIVLTGGAFALIALLLANGRRNATEVHSVATAYDRNAHRNGSCFRFGALLDGRQECDETSKRDNITRAAHIIFNASVLEKDTLCQLYPTLIVIDTCGRIAHVAYEYSSLDGLLEQFNARSLKFAGRLHDAHGKSVTRGLVDAHVHLLSGGIRLRGSPPYVDLSNISTYQQLHDVLHQANASNYWIRGHSLREQGELVEMPSRQFLDNATGKHIATIVEREDLHSASANSRALQLGGISDNNVSEDKREFMRGAYQNQASPNEYSGVLQENALGPVRRAALLSEANEERERSIEYASRHVVSLGITSLADMGDVDALASGSIQRLWNDAILIRQLAQESRLEAKVSTFVPALLLNQLHPAAEHELRARFGASEMHAVVGGMPQRCNLKHFSCGCSTKSQFGFACFFAVGEEFVDGSIGSWNALLDEPFNGTDGNYGTRLSSQADIDRYAAAATDPCNSSGSKGALALHAIGDKAVAEAVDAAIRWKYDPSFIFRIEHMTLMRSGEIQREAKKMAQSGAIASIQGYEAYGCALFALDRLGRSRYNACTAHQSLVNAGARVALSTDWPVSDLDAVGNMQAAIWRTEPLTAQQASQHEGLTLYDALVAYIVNSRYATNHPEVDQTLELKPGSNADLVIWDCDIKQVERCPSKAMKTFVSGTCVHGCTP